MATQNKYDPNRDIDTSSIDSLAAQLDAETTLSQRQAEALAHEYFGVPRQKSADVAMNVSPDEDIGAHVAGEVEVERVEKPTL
jgi:hypothetical protein